MILGMKIKLKRVSQRIYQKDLAEQIGITQAKMCRIEQGKKEPSISELQKIAAALNVDLTELLGS